jgi:hypothetical protein
MTKGSDNPFPSVLLTEGAPPAAPAAGKQRLWTNSSNLNMITAAGVQRVIGAGASGNYTSGVVWTSGTSMPGGPATNQRVTRTDLGLDFYYDGTRWLSTTLYTLQLAGDRDGFTTAIYNGNPIDAALTAGTLSRASIWHSDFAIWLVSLYGETFTSATNDGSHHWHFALSGAVTSTAYGNFTTESDTAGVHTGHAVALNQAAGSTERAINLGFTKTGTPGACYWAVGIVTYRLIGT